MSARPRITVLNLNKAHRLNASFIKKLSVKVAGLARSANLRQLNIAFLDDRAMRGLNKRYKGVCRSTDVLSFRIDLKEFEMKGFAGEIAISSDTAFKNARLFKASFEEEIMLYVIHGILHLTGYNDRTRRDFARMAKRQNDILSRICKNQDLSKVLMPR